MVVYLYDGNLFRNKYYKLLICGVVGIDFKLVCWVKEVRYVNYILNGYIYIRF